MAEQNYVAVYEHIIYGTGDTPEKAVDAALSNLFDAADLHDEPLMDAKVKVLGWYLSDPEIGPDRIAAAKEDLDVFLVTPDFIAAYYEEVVGGDELKQAVLPDGTLCVPAERARIDALAHGAAIWPHIKSMLRAGRTRQEIIAALTERGMMPPASDRWSEMALGKIINRNRGSNPMRTPRLIPTPAARAPVRAGFDPTHWSRPWMGDTALHWAAFCGDVEWVKVLLGAGADPNATDNAGNTPLHRAAEWGNSEPGRLLVARLLAAGADPNIPDNAGNTPIDSAQAPGHAKILDLLQTAVVAGDKRRLL